VATKAKKNKKCINFDMPTIMTVVKWAKILRLAGGLKHSEISQQNPSQESSPGFPQLQKMSDIQYPPDLSDPGTLVFYISKNALIAYLTSLSHDTVYDIIALMYLGRNGEYDGIRSVPVHRRFALYDHHHCFYNDKQRVIKHMVSKSRCLDEYLETGLRLIKWID